MMGGRLERIVESRDIRGTLVFLGTGTSHGVPVIGCGCPTCTSPDRRNNRTRCSVVLGLPGGNLLVDTPPELRIQLTRERIGLVHALLYTHAHADHLFGLDDSRIFPEYLGHELPVFCTAEVELRIRQAFNYAFDPALRPIPGGGVPRLTVRTITDAPFEVLGATIRPIPLEHGQLRVFGYRVGDVAYCTDTKRIPPQSMALLEGLDVLILDCLRRRPHPTHMNLDEALAVVRQLRPRRTLFTHLCHELEHQALAAELPPGIEIAYDGLELPLSLDLDRAESLRGDHHGTIRISHGNA